MQFCFLSERHERNCWVLQEGAACRTPRTTLDKLEEFLGDRVTLKGLWPSCSPNLISLFFLSGSIKENVHKTVKKKYCNNWNGTLKVPSKSLLPKPLLIFIETLVCKFEWCIQNNKGHLQHVLQTVTHVLSSEIYKTQCSIFGYVRFNSNNPETKLAVYILFTVFCDVTPCGLEICTNVLAEPPASIFMVGNWGRRFLRNISTFLPNLTASHPRRT
jgi:hypothetical protein